ncbi:hypothetical protein V8F06_014882 [Rhypophila decipiens]
MASQTTDFGTDSQASQQTFTSSTSSSLATTTTTTTTSSLIMISRGLSINDLLNPSTPKKRSKKTDLSRDQRLQIQALHKYAGLTQVEIARRTPFLIDQVRHALHNPATPKKKKNGTTSFISTPPNGTN